MNALLTATERLRGISLTMLFLDHLEGNRPYAYPDTSGKWTIGIGHLLSKEELQSGKLLIDNQPYPWAYERRDYPQSPGLSPGAISALLWQDLRPIVSQEPPGILEQRLRVPLTGPQIAALASFVFNLGQATFVESKCTLLRRLNQGDYLAVPSELSLEVLQQRLETLADDLMVELKLQPTEKS